jgi:hypothetical protein
MATPRRSLLSLVTGGLTIAGSLGLAIFLSLAAPARAGEVAPAVDRPDQAAEPEAAKPEAAKPEAAKPEAAKAEAAKPEAAKPEAAKAEAARPVPVDPRDKPSKAARKKQARKAGKKIDFGLEGY